MKNCNSTKIKAVISFLPTEEGGRMSGMTTGYRPNHVFLGPDSNETCIGQVTVENDRWVQPGESEEVLIEFICLPTNYLKLLKVGFKWRIQEGARLVANAVVTEVF